MELITTNYGRWKLAALLVAARGNQFTQHDFDGGPNPTRLLRRLANQGLIEVVRKGKQGRGGKSHSVC